MESDLVDLRRRLEVAERSASLWHSKMAVLFLVLLVGGAGTALWAYSSLRQELEHVQARLARLEAPSVRSRVVEAEGFVVRDSAGIARAAFGIGLPGTVKSPARLSFFEKGVQTTVLSSGSLLMYREDQTMGVVLAAGEEHTGIHVTNPNGDRTVFSAGQERSGYGLYSAAPIGSGLPHNFSAVKPEHWKESDDGKR